MCVVTVGVCLREGIRVHVNTFVGVVSASLLSFWQELSTFNYVAASFAL